MYLLNISSVIFFNLEIIIDCFAIVVIHYRKDIVTLKYLILTIFVYAVFSNNVKKILL